MSESQPIQWTPQQLAAIRHDGSSVLVSAGAGAGKTEVLARHCAELLSRSQGPCSIDELLVVTFTEAAAAQMRQRIGRIIRELVQQHPDDKHLAKQAARISTAPISTIHSFCQTVLRQNFAQAGLEPHFTIIDPDEALLAKRAALDEVFEELYLDKKKEGPVFAQLVDLYGDGDDTTLGQVVMKLNDFLGSVVAPGQWSQKASQWLQTQSGKPSKEMLRAYGELLIEKFEQRMSLCEHNAQKIMQLAQLEEVKGLGIDQWAMLARFGQLLSERIDGWARLIEKVKAGEFDKLANEIEELIVKRIPSAPKADNHVAINAIEQIKKLFREAAPTASNEKLLETLGISLEQHAKALQQSEPYGQMILELAKRLGTKYERAKQRENRLDFGDLERKCFELLNDSQADELVPSVVAKELQQRYRYVLVDEYQDINPLQNAILLLASCELSSKQQNNLFAVGDVKQSIYRFRLAEPGIFTARLSRADQDGQGVIDLQSNFRCRERIIKGVNLLFERLMAAQLGGIAYDNHARLKLGQTEYAKLDDPGKQTLRGPAVEVHFLTQQRKGHREKPPEQQIETEHPEASLEQIQQEAVLAGQRIRHLMGLDEAAQPAQVMAKDAVTGQMRLREIEYRDVAVLLRVTSRQAQSFARVLRQMDIPVYSDAETGYFAATEIQDVLALLEILDNPLQDIPLAAVLHSPLGGFKADDLAQIRLANKGTAFHEVVLELAQTEDANNELARRLNEFWQRLTNWRRLVREIPLDQALWEIYQQTGYLQYVRGLTGGAGRVANLLKLYERARQFGDFARTGLRRFLQFLNDLKERDADLGMAPSLSEAQNVVRIMSIHKSKGLEFPVVILPRLSQKFNFRDTQGKIIFDRQRYLGMQCIDAKQGISYPSLGHLLAKDNIERQVRAEEMRLLYVGLTRAREHLILIGSGTANKLDPFVMGATDKDVSGAGQPRGFELAAGRNLLDWLVPALASLKGDDLKFTNQQVHPDLYKGKATFVLSVHEAEKFGADIFDEDRGKHHRRDGLSLEQIAQLQSSEELPKPSEELAKSLALMNEPYPYEELANLPAAITATERKRLFESHADQELEQFEEFTPSQEFAKLAQVASAKKQGPSAREIGSLNHLFMQKVDLSRTCNLPDLKQQAKDMVAAGVLDKATLGLIDIAGAASFFATDIGQAMLSGTAKVYRELPFVLAIEPGELAKGAQAAGPQDRPIVRGIIDALIVENSLATIVDFKTDRISKQELTQRAKEYQWQMKMYARAVEDILNLKKLRKVLYFLSQRELVQM